MLRGMSIAAQPMEQDTAPPLPEPPSEWMNLTQLSEMLLISRQRIRELVPDAEAVGVTVHRDAKGAVRLVNAAEFLAWWARRRDRRRKE